MTVHGWCPNHESGTTDRIATSGKTARSTQFAEDEVVIGDRDPEAFLLSGLRSASSQVPEMNACLSCRAAPSLLDHCATVKTFLSTDGRLRLPSARRSPRHGVLTAGCIDTDLHPQVDVTSVNQTNPSSRPQKCNIRHESHSLKPTVKSPGRGEAVANYGERSCLATSPSTSLPAWGRRNHPCCLGGRVCLRIVPQA